MAGLRALLRSPFSFLFATKGVEDRIAAYVVREHDRGRTMDDILDDPYVINRCSPLEIARLLERPDVVHAVGEDLARSHAALLRGGDGEPEAADTEAPSQS